MVLSEELLLWRTDLETVHDGLTLKIVTLRPAGKAKNYFHSEDSSAAGILGQGAPEGNPGLTGFLPGLHCAESAGRVG